MEIRMLWYAVSLLLKSTNVSKPEVDIIWEERIILVRANSEEEARSKGTQIGKEAEHEYTVLDDLVKEDIVRWTFEQIQKVYLIEDVPLKEGTELFSRFLRDSTVKSLLTPFEDD